MFFALFLFHTANAQSALSLGALTPVSVEAKNSNPGLLALDTMTPPVFTMACFTGDAAPLVYYQMGAAGMLVGNNSYGETEAAQRYAFTGSGTIGEVLVMYGHVTGTTGTTAAKVYSITAKKPGTVLGTSGTVTLANITTTGYTSYTFSPTVSVTTNFAVASVFPTTAAAGDTVAVVSTKETCHSVDSLSYMKIPNYGGWLFANQLLNVTIPRDTSLDLVILPVVNVTTGINEYPNNNGLTLMGTFPNPARDFINLRYRLEEQSAVSIEIFDLTGRIIEKSSENLSAGEHNIKVSLKDLSAGNYYYTIKTGKTQLTSKFAVIK